MIRDPVQIKNSNIWQKAGKINESQTNLDKRTVIILGDQNSGKTSFIKIIKGDYDLQTKPTRLIDFYTMKKQSVQFQFYQISSPKFQSMIEYYLKNQTIAFTTFVLCIDLTYTQTLVSRINKKIQDLRSKLKQISNKQDFTSNKAYNQQRSKYYHYIQKNDDIQIIKRMPFHFILVGCKCDLFQKLQIEQKKWISRCLRYLAHVNQADLFYCSTKNLQVCAELRNIFIQELLCNRSPALSLQKDHTKPIFILTGQDKISQMNLPAFNNSGAFNQLKILQQQLQSVFPSKKNIQVNKSQIKMNKFTPIGIDSLIEKHKKEISNIMNQRRRRKFGTDKNLNSTKKFGLTNNFDTTNNLGMTNNFNSKDKQNKNQIKNILQSNQGLQQSQQIQDDNLNIKNNKINNKQKQKEHYMDQDQNQFQDQDQDQEDYQG